MRPTSSSPAASSLPLSSAPSTISALSPLDGRYAARLAGLRPFMSEQGYMHRRVQVEIAWFIALSDAGLAEFKPLSPGARTYLMGLVKNFSEADGQAIKDIEKVTNHDVKAVEYWIKSRFEARPELERSAEFVHFACTSEDINNTSHALQLKGGRDAVLLPALDAVITTLREMAHAYATVPMLSRTHGQTASPTTLGKEAANVAARLATVRAATGGGWLDHAVVKFVAFPLLPALVAFRLHQVITFGGFFGEAYTYGISAWLLGLVVWWASWALGLMLFAAVLRVAIETLTGAAMAFGTKRGVTTRRVMTWLASLAYFVGVPAWLAMKLLAA